MPLRARRDAGKAGPRFLSRRVLALISLLWPLRSSAFLLNLTFAPRHAILRSCCSQRQSSIVGVAAGSWARPTGQLRRSSGRYPGSSSATEAAARGKRLRPVTATAAAARAGDDSGYAAESEKVYRVDNISARKADIDASRASDENDPSPETLETPSGAGGGGVSRGDGGDGGGDGEGWGGYDRSRFHIHFGAGRLGLGLVVGAIAQSKTPFGVVQRPKASWGGIISHGCGALIDLTVNGKTIVSDVTVIGEGCDIEEYLKVGRAAMVVVGDRPTLSQLVGKATSFSCSLGAAMTIAMVPLLSELEDKPYEERPVLYACENDHDAVRRVGETITSKITTVPCMVDRICTGRQIGEYEVNVEAEPNFGGSLVLLDPPSDPSLVPFAGPTVLIPATREEANYFYKRKFSVVNGMHTVLGFMTLREKAPGAKELREHDLLAYDTASPEIRAELWAWVVVRCLALLDEFGVDMLKSAHDVETEEEVFDVLLNYGRQALDRFSSVVDSTSRVLGGGLGNRLTTRLQPMVAFMKANTMTGSGLPGERFLKRAGVEETFAKEAVQSLARSSIPFCTQEFMAAKQARIEARAVKAVKVEENKATRVLPDAKTHGDMPSSGKQEKSVASG